MRNLSISSWYSHKLPHWKTAFFFRPPAYDTKMAKEAIDSMFYVTWWMRPRWKVPKSRCFERVGVSCFPGSFIFLPIHPLAVLFCLQKKRVQQHPELNWMKKTCWKWDGKSCFAEFRQLRVVLYHCHFQSSSWLHVVCLSKFFIALPEEKHPIHLCTSFEVWYGNLFPCQLFFQDPS